MFGWFKKEKNTNVRDAAIDLGIRSKGKAALESTADILLTTGANTKKASKWFQILKNTGKIFKVASKRMPVIGAVFTAGFVAKEIISLKIQGKNKKVLRGALAAGIAEISGNFFGFGIGDAAREFVHGGLVKWGGDDFKAVQRSDLLTVAQWGFSKASNAFNNASHEIAPSAAKPFIGPHFAFKDTPGTSPAFNISPAFASICNDTSGESTMMALNVVKQSKENILDDNHKISFKLNTDEICIDTDSVDAGASVDVSQKLNITPSA